MISSCICSRRAAGSAALASLGLAFTVWTPHASAGGVCQPGPPVNLAFALPVMGDFSVPCAAGAWWRTSASVYTLVNQRREGIRAKDYRL